MRLRIAFVAPLLLLCSGAAKPDRLPLKHGIFVVEGVACKGASNAATLSYWGGDNGINDAHDRCRIVRLTGRGSSYHLRRACRMSQGVAEENYGDRVAVAISSSTKFSFVRTSPQILGLPPLAPRAFRYCGPKVQW